jgi:hypothetical protein
MPAVFVLIWSTGFVVARLGMPHAPPLGFLAWRYALSVLLFGAWVAWSRPPGRAAARSGCTWPSPGADAGRLPGRRVGGRQGGPGCRHGGADRRPAAAAHGAVDVGTRTSAPCQPRQWLGLLLGLAAWCWWCGTGWPAGQVSAWNLALALLALVQHHGRHPVPEALGGALRRAHRAVVQLTAAGWSPHRWRCWRPRPWHWHPDLLLAMAWSVVALTLGGSSLLYLLIQRGAATRQQPDVPGAARAPRCWPGCCSASHHGHGRGRHGAVTACGVGLVLRRGAHAPTDGETRASLSSGTSPLICVSNSVQHP